MEVPAKLLALDFLWGRKKDKKAGGEFQKIVASYSIEKLLEFMLGIENNWLSAGDQCILVLIGRKYYEEVDQNKQPERFILDYLIKTRDSQCQYHTDFKNNLCLFFLKNAGYGSEELIQLFSSKERGSNNTFSSPLEKSRDALTERFSGFNFDELNTLANPKKFPILIQELAKQVGAIKAKELSTEMLLCLLSTRPNISIDEELLSREEDIRAIAFS